MNTYRFHWTNGKVDESRGKNETDALVRAGHSLDSYRALEFVECWYGVPGPDAEIVSRR